MKTPLRIPVIILLVAASASGSFAGPGLQYWNARREARIAAKAAPAESPAASCDRMLVKQGKRTVFVKCNKVSAQCKAHCES